VVSRKNPSTNKLGEWLKKQTALLLNVPRSREQLEKVVKLLSVRLLFPNNEVWKKVIQMLLTKASCSFDGSVTLESEFFTEMLNYLQMLFNEYQEGAKPCISRDQAEQLQRLLGIPRTAMDVKRRKKNDSDRNIASGAVVVPSLPSINEFVALPPLPSSTTSAVADESATEASTVAFTTMAEEDRLPITATDELHLLVSTNTTEANEQPTTIADETFLADSEEASFTTAIEASTVVPDDAPIATSEKASYSTANEASTVAPVEVQTTMAVRNEAFTTTTVANYGQQTLDNVSNLHDSFSSLMDITK
jgi:hypothetical protein